MALKSNSVDTVFLCALELVRFTNSRSNSYAYCSFHLLCEAGGPDEAGVRAFRVYRLKFISHVLLLNTVIADFVDLIFVLSVNYC